MAPFCRYEEFRFLWSKFANLGANLKVVLIPCWLRVKAAKDFSADVCVMRTATWACSSLTRL